MGEIQTKIPTEVMITERREFELAEEGFIALTLRKGSDNAAFFSANSVQKPKYFGNSEEGKAAETNYRLGTQLPYMFIISRLAHYIKVHAAREHRHRGRSAADLETRAQQLDPASTSPTRTVPCAGVRGRRPLRKAEIVGRGRRGRARLVPGRPEGAAPLQVHGRLLHAVASWASSTSNDDDRPARASPGRYLTFPRGAACSTAR